MSTDVTSMLVREQSRPKIIEKGTEVASTTQRSPTVSFELGATDSQFVATAGEFRLVLDHDRRAGPRSVELLLLALGSCTIANLNTYMRRKGLPTDTLKLELSCNMDPAADRYGSIEITLHIDPAISTEQRNVLLAVARSCRIHKTLEHCPDIRIEISEAAAKGWNGVA